MEFAFFCRFSTQAEPNTLLQLLLKSILVQSPRFHAYLTQLSDLHRLLNPELFATKRQQSNAALEHLRTFLDAVYYQMPKNENRDFQLPIEGDSSPKDWMRQGFQ